MLLRNRMGIHIIYNKPLCVWHLQSDMNCEVVAQSCPSHLVHGTDHLDGNATLWTMNAMSVIPSWHHCGSGNSMLDSDCTLRCAFCLQQIWLEAHLSSFNEQCGSHCHSLRNSRKISAASEVRNSAFEYMADSIRISAYSNIKRSLNSRCMVTPNQILSLFFSKSIEPNMWSW